MGNAECGGESKTSNPYGSRFAHVVLCRPGPYVEVRLSWESLRRDPPDGVEAFVTEDCVGFDPGGATGEDGAPLAVECLSSGDRCFLLCGEHERGAEALRFGLGDRVKCPVSTARGMSWKAGTVIGLWYHEAGWPTLAPYQVRLDGVPGECIFVPHDNDHLIRSFDERSRICGIVPLGPLPEVPREGARVLYRGGGRWGGDVELEDGWTLRTGAEGVVMRSNGSEKHKGLWPVEVQFSRSGAAGELASPVSCRSRDMCIPVALTARDLHELTVEEIRERNACPSIATASPRRTDF
eukprot:Hpha_TRINITY_DN14345_c0_g1::TRINITY_DN14345_c0_g1_i1::g.86654::m.86654